MYHLIYRFLAGSLADSVKDFNISLNSFPNCHGDIQLLLLLLFPTPALDSLQKRMSKRHKKLSKMVAVLN